MILFLGDEVNADFIKNVIDEPIEYESGLTLHNLNNMSSKAFQNIYNYIFIDIEKIYAEANKIVDKITEIHLANNTAQIIVIAIGYDAKSQFIRLLEEKGFYNVINATKQGEMIEQLELILAGKNIPVKEKDILEIVNEAQKELTDKVKIGIVGCCHRIGTTTQALQIIKYLQKCGKKVCYIESNSNEYVKNLEWIYDDIIEDKAMGLYRCNDIDFYTNLTKLPEILNLDYQYYIYDFGCIDDEKFNTVNFLEKDMQIIVGGTKANEMPMVHTIFSSGYINAKTQWIFSFVEPNYHQDMKEAMEEYSEQTYFAPVCLEPFFFNNEHKEIYEKLLNIKLEMEVENKPKKRWWKKL